jgi:hypothetical protein
MFNEVSKLGGYGWLQLFLIRHLELRLREAQGLSIARGRGMCRIYGEYYFTMLLQICQQNGFQANPRKIFSMDECGLQMNGGAG